MAEHPVPSGDRAVVLQPVAEPDKAVLANLFQLYCHGLSKFRGFEVSEHRTFSYRLLDHYWTEPGRNAFIIRSGDNIAGFALVATTAEGERERAEFFILRAHRREGVGRAAAQSLLAQFSGSWVVAHDKANDTAGRFWTTVIGDA